MTQTTAPTSINRYGDTAAVTFTLPSGRKVEFTVEGPRTRFGNEQVPASVNWSGIGSSTAVDARYFAEALAVCSDLAENFDAIEDAR